MAELKDILSKSNVQLGEAEQNQFTDFLKFCISDTLVFRNAKGQILNKEKYLEQVAARQYNTMNTEIQDVIINKDEKAAMILAKVTTSGIDKDSVPFNGSFRNMRFWTKENDGVWRITLWYNEKL